MAKLIAILSLLLFFGSVLCQDYIELTDEEYHQMPELFHMEHYERCISQRNHAYCEATFELSLPKGTQSKLYERMKRYSDTNMRQHFNHTRLHRAVCLGPTTKCNISGPLDSSFEECIDKRMQNEYGFRAKLLKLSFCRRSGENRSLDGADIVFIIYFLIIVLLNISGTAYHLYKDDKSRGNPWLMAFSLRDNWKRLTTETEGDSRLKKLRCLNGLKGFAMILVHLNHSVLITFIAYLTTPKFTEQASSTENSTVANGPVIVQAFIVIANFLITYKLLLHAETAQVNFKLLPKIVVDRLARIVPLMMTVIALISTVAVYANDGPLWTKLVIGEANYCRATWWHHLLFINNFFPPTCMPQSWYIAMDFQLYIISSVILLWIISRRLNAERILTSLLFASMAFIFIIAYWFELDPPVLHNTPENTLTLHIENKSFLRLYQTFWGNLPSAILGVLTACIHHRLEKENADLSKNKLFTIVYRYSFLAAFLWTMSGTFLMQNVKSRLVISLFATIEKPIFGLAMGFLILGCSQNIDGRMKKILECPKWQIPSRLSFGMFLIHVLVTKTVALSRQGPSTINVTNLISEWMTMYMLTFVVALPLSLLIEYPFVNLYKALNDLTKKNKLETEIITNGNSNNEHDPNTNGKSKYH